MFNKAEVQFSFVFKWFGGGRLGAVGWEWGCKKEDDFEGKWGWERWGMGGKRDGAIVSLAGGS